MTTSPYKQRKITLNTHEANNRNTYIKALQTENERLKAENDNLRRLLKLDIQMF